MHVTHSAPSWHVLGGVGGWLRATPSLAPPRSLSCGTNGHSSVSAFKTSPPQGGLDGQRWNVKQVSQEEELEQKYGGRSMP